MAQLSTTGMKYYLRKFDGEWYVARYLIMERHPTRIVFSTWAEAWEFIWGSH